MDIALDSFPYSGTTTTFESLMMGVPVVSLAQAPPHGSHSHNVSASVLTQVGREAWVAWTREEYTSIAAALASDTSMIAEQRKTLRAALLASPSCQGEEFMQAVDSEYRGMWTRYCAS
ncbi:hypothetical protein T484DRAFT_1762015 [Baffinella frigidus]|nr:hypothetical protein T484DRAFT_1762015 [Cryptophyta sp. CCMP2293]